MNDSLSGKNGKVKVMYVRSDENAGDGKGKSRQERSDRSKPSRSKHIPRKTDGNNTRYYERKDNAKNLQSPYASTERSPWKRGAWGEEQEKDHGGISGKSAVDPEQLRRQRAEETRVYGENACQALFASRSEAIVRAWFTQSVTPRFREALRWMAANRKAYHIVDEAELVKVSGTEHHGGVCFLIKKRGSLNAENYLLQVATQEKDCVIVLDDIGNPHNLGGIMRTGAHFGVNGAIVQDVAQLESGAAVRTAEGGAEHIQAIDANDFTSVLDAFRRAGYTVVSLSTRKGAQPLTDVILPNKMMLVLEPESGVLADCQSDMAIAIDGTGNVENINVSVATGIILAEWYRQNKIELR